jgi:benzodiazapine receptor
MPLPEKSLLFRERYDLLQKPAWTPSISTIGTILSFLYPLIIGIYGYAILKIIKNEWPKSLLIPILLNVVLSLNFTPVQFGLRNFNFASILVVGSFLTAVWSLLTIYPHNKMLSLALIQYILWTAIASVLQKRVSDTFSLNSTINKKLGEEKVVGKERF